MPKGDAFPVLCGRPTLARNGRIKSVDDPWRNWEDRAYVVNPPGPPSASQSRPAVLVTDSMFSGLLFAALVVWMPLVAILIAMQLAGYHVVDVLALSPILALISMSVARTKVSCAASESGLSLLQNGKVSNSYCWNEIDSYGGSAWSAYVVLAGTRKRVRFIVLDPGWRKRSVTQEVIRHTVSPS